MKCLECGCSKMQKTTVKGRVFPYKEYGDLKLTEDVLIWTCPDCSNLALNIEDIRLLDAGLEKSKNDLELKIGRMRCGNCGNRNFKRLNVKGRYFPHLSHDKLLLKKDVYLNVCMDCDNTVMFGGDSDVLSNALDQSLFIVEDELLCGFCESQAMKYNFSYESSELDCITGEKINVENASGCRCLNEDCKMDWINQEQEDYISEEVSKKARYRLNPEQIKILMNKIPIETRSLLIKKLGFDYKIFISALNGVKTLPDSYDLLLRLIVKNPKLLDDISEMESEKFKFQG